MNIRCNNKECNYFATYGEMHHKCAKYGIRVEKDDLCVDASERIINTEKIIKNPKELRNEF